MYTIKTVISLQTIHLWLIHIMEATSAISWNQSAISMMDLNSHQKCNFGRRNLNRYLGIGAKWEHHRWHCGIFCCTHKSSQGSALNLAPHVYQTLGNARARVCWGGLFKASSHSINKLYIGAFGVSRRCIYLLSALDIRTRDCQSKLPWRWFLCSPQHVRCKVKEPAEMNLSHNGNLFASGSL